MANGNGLGKQDETVKESEDEILKRWYSKRRWSLMVMYIHSSLYMFELSAITISSLYYFKYTIKTPNPKLYYSLVTSAVYVVAPFSAVLIGRYVDRTRELRKTVFTMALFNVLGNLMYIFPVFDWFPIVGRILCGIPDGIRAAISGKLFCPLRPKLSNFTNKVQKPKHQIFDNSFLIHIPLGDFRKVIKNLNLVFQTNWDRFKSLFIC